MADKIKESDIVDGNIWKDTTKNTQALIDLVAKLEEQLKGFAEVSKKALGGASETSSFEDLKKANAEIDKLNKAFEDKLKLDKQREALIKTQAKAEAKAAQERQNQIAKDKKAAKEAEASSKKKIDNTEKERLASLRLQKSKQIVANKVAALDKKDEIAARKKRQLTLDNANAFKRLSKQVNNAQARFKRLAAQYGENDKRTKKALKTFNRLDSKLRSINKTARDGRRDVGRYGTAFSGLFRSIKNIATGLVIVQGLRAIGNAIRDAFNRIVEFDKELQNIAGITGKSRESLKDLEEAITFVSKSSIKTSVEVAKLATTLFTLGKTKEEVKLLLAPVNNLAIAFRVSSDAAADFLGQTLNAFGKGAGSAQRFADIIANVRTSTSLDFERIKDGLGFIAPTANALNLTLGETSALLGVLQDNGVRAARAGRLLNSSFARIIDKGLTLDDALEKINKSQDKVSTSSELFGKEALALGLILADNTEKTADLADEFDNLSNGSLKELTDKQLGSLSAKLTILDSTWEALIITVENGTGSLATFFKKTIIGITDVIEEIRKGQLTNLEFLDENTKKLLRNFTANVEKEANKQILLRRSQLKADLKALEDLGLSEAQLIRRRKSLIQDFNRFRKGATDKERDEAINLYNKELDSITEKYYGQAIFNEEAFNNAKLKIQEKFQKRTDDARTISLREQKKEIEAELEGFKGSVGFGVDIDLENTREQFSDFYDFTLKKQSDFVAKTTKLQNGKFVSLYPGEEFQKETDRVGRLFTDIVATQEELIQINALIEDVDFDNLVVTPKGGDDDGDGTIIGLINKQIDKISKLRKSIGEAKTEEDIFNLGEELDVAEAELKRLERLYKSTFEEIDRIERDLIEDDTERVIANEIAKSEKKIEAIESNAKLESDLKEKLIAAENKRLAEFVNEEEIKKGKKAIESEANIALAVFKQKKTGFKTEEKFQKELAAQTEAINLRKLEKELALLQKFNREKDKERIAFLKGEIESYEKLGKERIKAEVDIIALLEALNEKYFSDQLDKLDRQISDLEKRERNLQDLANRGNEEAASSLAQSQKDQAEAQKKKEDLLQREKQFEFALAVIGAFNAELESNPEGGTAEALTKAITSTSVLTSFIQAIPFFDGTEDTGSGGGVDNKGGFHAILHPNERVVSKKDNMKMGGVSNEEAANIVHDFNNDLLSYNTPQLVMKENRFDSTEQILSKFDQLSKDVVSAINNKETYLGSDIDTIKKMIIQDYSKGGTRTKVKSKYPTRR